jgi:hypothetical protein
MILVVETATQAADNELLHHLMGQPFKRIDKWQILLFHFIKSKN